MRRVEGWLPLLPEVQLGWLGLEGSRPCLFLGFMVWSEYWPRLRGMEFGPRVCWMRILPWFLRLVVILPLGQRLLCVLPVVYRIWAPAPHGIVQLEGWFKSWFPSVYSAGGGRSSIDAWYTTALDVEEVPAGAVDFHVHIFVTDVVKSFDAVNRGFCTGFSAALACLLGFVMRIF